MDNTEFDNFIKAAAKKELEAAPFLNWENMNIPVKKRKNRFAFLWFFLLLLLGFAGAWGWNSSVKGETEKDVSNSTLTEPHSQSERKELSSAAQVSPSGSFPESEISDIDQMNASSSTSIAPIMAENESSRFSSSVKNNKQYPNHFPKEIETDRFEANGTDTRKTAMPLPESRSLEEVNAAFNGRALSLEKIPTRFPVSVPTHDSVLQFSNAPMLPLTLPVQEWQLSAGFNSYRNQLASSGSSSKDFGINSFGQSIAISRLRPIKKQTHLILGLRYTGLHHYYQEVRDLGYESDLNAGQRITNQYVLRHHNRHHLIGLDFGLSHAIFITHRLQFYLQGEMSPLLSLASRGKLFAPGEADVIELSNDNNSAEFLFSGSLGIGVNYAMSKNTQLIFGPSFTHYFNSFQLASGLDESIKPQILTLNLGFRRSLH
jgi:cytoskeletal protein RodZ